MRKILAIALIFSIAGCAGPFALRSSRHRYNNAIQQTNSEQLLRNLVRLRYRDPTAFMELTSLSTQFVFEQSAFANGTITEAGALPSVLRVGGTSSAEQRPTVTYDMLQGQQFVTRFISPLNVETVILLIRSGWSAERVLRITVQNINGVDNARTASGPTPELAPEFIEFRQLAQNIRELQTSGEVQTGYDSLDKRLSGAIPASRLQAEDFVAAAKEGWELRPHQERVLIESNKIRANSPAAEAYIIDELLSNLIKQIDKNNRPSQPLRVEFSPESENGEKLEAPFLTKDHLTLEACKHAGLERIPCIVEFPNEDYYLTSSKESLIIQWDKDEISEPTKQSLEDLPLLGSINDEHYPLDIEPRSLMGSLYYLSHAIHVPVEHVAEGLVTTTAYEWGEPFDWSEVSGDLLQVCSQKRRPKNAAVAIKYRGHWFYIADYDTSSKSTFTLLLQLFELQAGGAAQGTKPVLTLSVGN